MGIFISGLRVSAKFTNWIFVSLIPLRPYYGYDWIPATEGIANQDEYLCLKAVFEEKLHCI